jgi:hypothetical protein
MACLLAEAGQASRDIPEDRIVAEPDPLIHVSSQAGTGRIAFKESPIAVNLHRRR